MANWARIQTLPVEYQRQIISMYNQNFPFEIRMHLADWIERQNWSFYVNKNHNNGLMDDSLRLLFSDFSTQIQQLMANTNDICIQYKLDNFLKILSNESQLIDIIKWIDSCLKYEQYIILSFEQGTRTQTNENIFYQINNQCQLNKNDIVHTENIYKFIKEIKENLNIKELEFNILEKELRKQTISEADYKARQTMMTSEVNTWLNQYREYKTELIAKYHSLIRSFSSIYDVLITNQLNLWKQDQVQNNTETPDNLVQIKKQCEFLADNMCLMWKQLKGIEALSFRNDEISVVTQFKQFKAQITMLLKNLVNETFIVIEQPNQVIKKDTRFNATVNLLVGSVLKVHLNPPLVNVYLINEEQAKRWYADKENFQINSCFGEILNNKSITEYNPTTKNLSANFINLRLKTFKRSIEKKATEDKVVDEKFALLFTTEFFLEQDTKIIISTLSAPVVVIVHGNQKVGALSTIIWDNSFSQLTRAPFCVPTEVRFSELAKVLSRLFYQEARRHLSEENLQFLAEKLLTNDFDKHNYFNAMISFTKFCKEPLLKDLKEHNSFWHWFYEILQLTRDHLSELWTEGHIIGFLPRQRAEMWLSEKPIGTFLLRFSDTQLGGISVAFVNKNNVVEYLMPFGSADLKIRNLPDRLHDLQEFHFLYPDIPKDQAFSKFYTRMVNQTANGYVRTQLRNYIPSEGSTPSTGYNSNVTSSLSADSTMAPINLPMDMQNTDPFVMDFAQTNQFTTTDDFMNLYLPNTE